MSSDINRSDERSTSSGTSLAHHLGRSSRELLNGACRRVRPGETEAGQTRTQTGPRSRRNSLGAGYWSLSTKRTKTINSRSANEERNSVR